MEGLDQDVQGTFVINLVPLLKLVVIIQVKSLATNRTGGLELSSGAPLAQSPQRTIMNKNFLKKKSKL